MTSITPQGKRNNPSIPKNLSTSSNFQNPSSVKDDSSDNPTRFYPYQFSLPCGQCVGGCLCAGSAEGAKRIVQALDRKAKEIQIGESIPYIFKEKKTRSFLKKRGLEKEFSILSKVVSSPSRSHQPFQTQQSLLLIP